jgi:pimeloyl-ACP methyl ester carboxylesterase
MTSATQHRLPVYDHRPGTGPTLVFLHYWGGSARSWQPVVTRLPGRSTLSIDFRGWSRSSDLPGPYTLDQLAQDTLAVIQAAGLTEYVLVGHSMGGKVAQLVAGTHPKGLVGLVLVGPGPARPAAEITPEYQAGLSHAYDSDELVAGARDNILTATALTEELKAQVVSDSLSGSPDARSEWPLHGIAEDITGHTRQIDVPVLVIAGEHDRVEPVGVLRQNLMPYLADAQLVVIPATGHLVPLEAPDGLAQAILAFELSGNA